MKVNSTFLFRILLLLLLTVSCEKKPPYVLIDKDKDEDNNKAEVPLATQFVYDGMSTFYLWSDEVESKKPTTKDTDPEKYFYSILNKTDTEHGWSWITDDIESLLADFAGEATNEFGFSVFPLWSDSSRESLFGFVRYVYQGTPAEDAGIVRGNVISEINGQKITLDNYQLMFGSNKKETFTILDQDFSNPRDVSILPARFDANPVHYYDIIEEDGRKIAYLFYTGFRSNFNNKLYEAFTEFKNAGVDELVLDLRYNPGGDMGAAIYLASLIAPRADVESKSTFSIMSYNNLVNQAYDRNNWSRSSKLGVFDDNRDTNPLEANLNLNRVYVIAQNSSASASELTTFCLRPFMEVNHIGEITAGKYTASWTIHAYNSFPKDGQALVQTIYDESKLTSDEKSELRNWGMQPIVGRYTDKNDKDFIKDNGLIPNYPIESREYNTETWKPIGDPDDYLLAKAISLITGKPYTTSTRFSTFQGIEDEKLLNPTEKIIRQSVRLTDFPIEIGIER